jgi:two-component system response regulator DevR
MTVQQQRESAPAMNEVAQVRVFLLDDHEIVRRGIADLLAGESDVSVVGEAGTAAEALRRIPEVRPDVAVLDARLPDGSGIDVCREIRSAHPEIHCLILTSYDDTDAIFAAVMAGASGYLLKPERLHLAEKTIKNYVSALLAKLGMQRRTQAAVYGAEVRRA